MNHKLKIKKKSSFILNYCNLVNPSPATTENNSDNLIF